MTSGTVPFLRMLRDAFFLGVVQGIAEWLPISSSGHLVLLQKLFNLKGGITFDVFLHLSSLLVICIFFRKDLGRLAKSVFFFRRASDEFYLGVNILLATLVTAAIGLGLKTGESLLDNLAVVAGGFLFTSLLLFFSVRTGNRTIDWKKALVIGLFQGAALLPGVSRAGSTIAGARILGVPNEEAFRFSFLLAAPAIFGAIVMELKEITAADPRFLLVGFGTSLFLSFFSLALLKRVVLKNRLHWFGYYCFLLSLVTFLILP